jgi:hypothetical protein
MTSHPSADANKKTVRGRSLSAPGFVEITLGVKIVSFVKALAVGSSGDHDRGDCDCRKKPDHAKANPFCLRL